MAGASDAVGWWFWAFGLLVALAIVVGLVVMIVALVRSALGGREDRSAPQRSTGGGTRSTLEHRLARGEITLDEFRDALGRTPDDGTR